MNRSVYYRTSLIAFSILTLVLLLGCFCWPSLPSLVHQGSCGWIQYAAQSGKQYVAPPPKNYIAYINKGDVWIMDPDGKNKKQLTKTAEREFSLYATYQAERIWFVRQNGPLAEQNTGDVYSCDYEGKNIQKVTAGIPVTFVAVSVDGKKMGVSVASNVEQTAPLAPYQTNDMWLMDAVEKNQGPDAKHVNLTGDLPPSDVGGREGSTFLTWSPQNDRVAFTFKADQSASLGISTKSVYIAKLDGSGRKKLIDSCAEPRFNVLGTMLAVTTGAHWDTMGVAQVSVDGDFSKDILPISAGNPLYSTATPFWVTTYENITENANVFYSKTTHPAAPADPVNTLEKYRIENGETTILISEAGANKAILKAWVTHLQNGIVFQKGFDPSTSSIWSTTVDGKELKRLSGSDTAGDSEPTSAVSYSWYNKNNGGTSTGTQFQTCHWPYTDNLNWPYQK